MWLVSRDEDAARLGTGAAREREGLTDVVVPEQRAIRVSRIPTRPRLGRKAREKRAAELRAEADALVQQFYDKKSAQVAQYQEELIALYLSFLSGLLCAERVPGLR